MFWYFSFTFVLQVYGLNFKSSFGRTLGEHLKMTASANVFYITIDFKAQTNIRVAATNINIKIHHLFSKQRILGVRAGACACV